MSTLVVRLRFLIATFTLFKGAVMQDFTKGPGYQIGSAVSL